MAKLVKIRFSEVLHQVFVSLFSHFAIHSFSSLVNGPLYLGSERVPHVSRWSALSRLMQQHMCIQLEQQRRMVKESRQSKGRAAQLDLRSFVSTDESSVSSLENMTGLREQDGAW